MSRMHEATNTLQYKSKEALCGCNNGKKKKKGMLNNTRKRRKTKDSLAGTLRNSCAYKFKPLARLEGI